MTTCGAERSLGGRTSPDRAVRFASGRLSGRPPKNGVVNMLAGLTTCGVCGHGMVVELGKYGCWLRRHVGVCENGLRMPADEAHEAVPLAVEEHSARARADRGEPSSSTLSGGAPEPWSSSSRRSRGQTGVSSAACSTRAGSRPSASGCRSRTRGRRSRSGEAAAMRDDSADRTRYSGFRGTFTNGKFYFESQEERDRYQIATYGAVKNGWREPDEAPGGRLRITRGEF